MDPSLEENSTSLALLHVLLIHQALRVAVGYVLVTFHGSSPVTRFHDGHRLFIAPRPYQRGSWYEHGSSVCCVSGLLTRFDLNSRPSTYVSSSPLLSYDLGTPQYLQFGVFLYTLHCSLLRPMNSNTQDLLHKHNHLHNHKFLDIPRLQRPTTSIIFHLNNSGS
ncbi:hypothetical protein F4604DRAFT_1285604 [Suillus subluteus]|nr:hypothetical protein F4604DRAFT_1285604 [Suillus subluteus]